MTDLDYLVRLFDGGNETRRKRFEQKDSMIAWVKDRVHKHDQTRIQRIEQFVLTTFQNTEWGLSPHDPWQAAPKPVSTLFLHHTVTANLPVDATVAEEKEQMRLLDSIAHSRGFNGISYCWVIFPSGRCYEGRGWGIVEAATENFNTTSDSIVFAGNYTSRKLSDPQQDAVRALINKAQRDGFLTGSGLNVRAHRETSQTSCPGDAITQGQIANIQEDVNG